MLNAQMMKLIKIHRILFTAVFTGLAVYTPLILHYFGGATAGRKFLPMPFFILLTGLVLGWRAGLAAGILSPVISFFLTGMPGADILPFIIIQLCVYGLVAGALKKMIGTPFSIFLAIASGFLAIGLALAAFSEIDAVSYVLSALKDGLFGLVIAFLFLPLISRAIFRFLNNER